MNYTSQETIERLTRERDEAKTYERAAQAREMSADARWLDARYQRDEARAEFRALVDRAKEKLLEWERVEEPTSDQNKWPAHLRDDAPFAKCNVCSRESYTPVNWGRRCNFPQPNGELCTGRFDNPTD